MKILLYGINFSPELTGTGKYTGEMAAWLAANGHEVRVITAPPYYPDWAVRSGYSALAWETENWEGVKIWRCPLWVPANPGGIKRLIHLATFALSSFPALLRQLFWRPHAVWVVEPALFCAPAAWMLARMSGSIAWLHVQDYELDAAFNLGLIKGRRLRRFAENAERWLMRRFDRVSTISGRMFERAVNKGVPSGRVKAFPNWVDISSIQPLSDTSAYRAKLAIDADTVVALYSGNMGGKQGLELLAEVATLLRGTPDVKFVFCGNGAGKDDLVQRCRGLENVQFLDLQPTERLNELLGLADIHLMPQRADAADLVMPSKLTGMMASGRAVVATATAETELAKVISVEARCGLVTPPGDATAMADAIRVLAANPNLRAKMGESARTYAEQRLCRDAVLRRFRDDLRACVSERSAVRVAETPVPDGLSVRETGSNG